MTDIATLAEMEGDLAPEILPVDARLAFTISRSALLPLFERAAAIAPAKELVQGSAYALLEAVEESVDQEALVRITATDGEQTITVREDEVSVKMAGRVLLTAKRVVDILKLAPQDTVHVQVLGDRATIRSGRAQWTVATPTGDSLPPLTDVKDITTTQVPTEAFLRALMVTRKAVAGSYRPTLMQVEVAAGHMTASDGGRLHRQAIEGLPTNLTFTIPAKVMDELAKALRAHDEEYFYLGADVAHLSFIFGEDTLSASRLMTPFPNVDNMLLVPAFENQMALTVTRTDLMDVIQRVRVNADQDYASIFLALIPGKADAEGNPKVTLAVRTRDPLGNTAQETLPCSFSGSLKKARELCLNHKYVTDLLQAMESEDVIFKIGDDTKTQKNPVFVEDVEQGFSGVVQQMRTDWSK